MLLFGEDDHFFESSNYTEEDVFVINLVQVWYSQPQWNLMANPASVQTVVRSVLSLDFPRSWVPYPVNQDKGIALAETN